MRILLIITGLLVGVPLLISAALQSYQAYVMTRTFSAVHDISQRAEQKRKIEAADSYYSKDNNFVIVRQNKSYAQIGYATFIEWNEFSKHKIASVTLILPFKALLGSEESMPDEELVDMIADARSTDVMLQECKLINQAFAGNCKISKVSAKVIEGGQVRVQAKLSFTYPAIVPASNSTEPVEYAFNFTETNTVKEQSDHANSLAVRKKMYANFARNCKNFAKTQGSCSIGALKVTQVPKRGSQNSIVTTSKGAFGYLTELK